MTNAFSGKWYYVFSVQQCDTIRLFHRVLKSNTDT